MVKDKHLEDIKNTAWTSQNKKLMCDQCSLNPGCPDLDSGAVEKTEQIIKSVKKQTG